MARRKYVIQGVAIMLVFIVLLACIIQYCRVSDQLKKAQNRLNWLEPEIAALSIENRKTPERSGEYNPAEFILAAEDKNYQRPYYAPGLNTQATPEPDWCYVPRLIQMNQHRLFLFSGGGSYFSDLRGILNLPQLKVGWHDPAYFYLLVINCRVKDIFWNDNQLMVVAVPTLKGVQIVKVKKLGAKMPSAWLLDNSYEIWEEAYR